jgi:hypothetical protein
MIPPPADYHCACCGKDLTLTEARYICKWDSPSDKRGFCSNACIAESEPPSDCRRIYPEKQP